ncbi:pyruvate kinase-like protein [Xylaria sp. CBS 124048]|nr:pyruvate kinase-like protein [Xylaria sp. CBS 124048]
MGTYHFSHSHSHSDPAPLPPPRVTVTSLRTGSVRPLVASSTNTNTSIITSGIQKAPRHGKIQLTTLGLAGDARQHPPHQSPDNALHQYNPAHYASWIRDFFPAADGSNNGTSTTTTTTTSTTTSTVADVVADVVDVDVIDVVDDFPDDEMKAKFVVGAFGENLSSEGLSEENLCVGDIFRFGPIHHERDEATNDENEKTNDDDDDHDDDDDAALIQVTMPRQPCYKLNHRFQHPKMSSLVQSTGRTGWLYRVLRPGYVAAGDSLQLIRRINPTWPLSRVQHYLYNDRNNPEALTELINLPGLSTEFVQLFEKRLRQGAEDMSGRLLGDVAVSWKSYTLVEKTRLSPRVQKFVFSLSSSLSSSSSPPENEPLPPFPHIRLKFGPPSNPFTRAYSIVSAHNYPQTFELAISIHDNPTSPSRTGSGSGSGPGSGSLYLHSSTLFPLGSTLKVARGLPTRHHLSWSPSSPSPSPSSTSPSQSLQSGAKHIFIIGGIGITAFLLTIQSLQKAAKKEEEKAKAKAKEEIAENEKEKEKEKEAKNKTPLHLEIHYAVRTPQEAIYLDQLPRPQTTIYPKSHGKRLNIADIIPPFSLPSSSSSSSSPSSSSSAEINPPHENLPNPIIYCCGPPSMLAEARVLTQQLGYPPSHLYFEEFGSTATGTGDPFEVEVAPPGKILQVPREKSLLDILNEAGFDIDSSCLIGNCGNCMVEYCKGEVEHHGVALDDEQKKTTMLSCVSRGKGRITVKC